MPSLNLIQQVEIMQASAWNNMETLTQHNQKQNKKKGGEKKYNK